MKLALLGATVRSPHAEAGAPTGNHSFQCRNTPATRTHRNLDRPEPGAELAPLGTMRTSIALALISVTSLFGACAAHDTEAADALAARDDVLAVEMDHSAEIGVADNDLGVDEARTMSIVEAPMHGTATIDEGGVLHYQPGSEYLGGDHTRYEITNPDGSTSSADVAIEVGCATCAIGTSIGLAWDPNAPSDNVLGYRLYLGATEDPAAMMMVDEVTVGQAGFDAMQPAVTYDAWADFRLRLGANACFRMTAFNGSGESGFSNAACKVVAGPSMRFGL